MKRCGEMSRKLRFLKDQISKAGLLSSRRSVLQPNVELEELEVCFFTFTFFYCFSDFFFFSF